MGKNKKESSSSSDSDTSVEDKSPPPVKKPKTSSSSKQKEDSEPSWCLEKNRFVKVREFRGKVMVDIREYYEKDGDLLPGKKGISLSATQWKKLKGLVKEIDQKVSEF